MSILLVEQDIDRALAASDRALCLLEGRVVMAGDSAGLDRDRLVSAYFGAPSAAGAAATKTGRGARASR